MSVGQMHGDREIETRAQLRRELGVQRVGINAGGFESGHQRGVVEHRRRRRLHVDDQRKGVARGEQSPVATDVRISQDAARAREIL